MRICIGLQDFVPAHNPHQLFVMRNGNYRKVMHSIFSVAVKVKL